MRWKYFNVQEWNEWFAWYPVRIEDEMVFMETIEKMKVFGSFRNWYEYRLKPLPKDLL